jgi:hypothetical protein
VRALESKSAGEQGSGRARARALENEKRWRPRALESGSTGAGLGANLYEEL